MDYSTLKTLAYSYTDREDQDAQDRFDDFLSVVESRINQYLRVQKMTSRQFTICRESQRYYTLPTDFRGMRQITVYNPDTSDDRTTLSYLNPEQFVDHMSYDDGNIYYTIIADQLQITPTQQDNYWLEMVYYQKLVGLSLIEATNWISENYPDIYLFGLCVEITAFAKDSGAMEIWESRYKEALENIEMEDSIDRWSGPPLQVRFG